MAPPRNRSAGGLAQGLRLSIPFRRRMRALAWAKVLLPLAALLLLSALVLLARPQGGALDALPFARAAEMAGEMAGGAAGAPGIDGPRLAGVAEDGTTLSLTARRIALPAAAAPGEGSGEGSAGAADGLRLEAPRLAALSPEGTRAEVSAPRGLIEGGGEALSLSGGVALSLSGPAGRYGVTAPRLDADLATARLSLEGPVAAEGPFGQLEAGGLVLTRGEGEGAARLVFNGGVRLLYRP